MKKFYMILAAILIAGMSFGQNVAMSMKAPAHNQTRSGWYNYYADDGSGYVGINLYTAGDKLAARYPVSALAALGANPQLTKVELYFSEYTYQGTNYNNKSVNIVVYQGGVYDEEEGYYTTAPTQVYSEPVTATQQGPTEFTLATPVNIDVNQELMVAVEMTGNTCYVMAHSDIPTAENLGNIMWYENEWVAMDFYTDNTQTTTECTPWYINLYIQDENTYVENSDISVGFMDVYPNPTEYSLTTLNIGTTDDLVIYPYIMNGGPDAVPTDQTINVTITINGVNPYNEVIPNGVIPMQWDSPFGSGYFSPVQVSEAYGLTFAASDLDALGVPSEFDVCITAAYTGVDNNSANNSTCLHVTRGGETPQISCDLEAMLFLDAQGATEVGATMTLAGDDDFLVFPAIKNNGPDAASSGTVTINVTMDGSPLIQPQSLALSSQMSIPSGQVVGITQSGLSLTAAQMDQYGITGTFEICYTITYSGTDPNTANNSKCVTVTRQSVAVEENIAEEVSVYPNPANDMFTVANAEGATIVVVNSLGQVVASIENAASNQTIDASNFANGTYFVKVNESVIKINVVK